MKARASKYIGERVDILRKDVKFFSFLKSINLIQIYLRQMLILPAAVLTKTVKSMKTRTAVFNNGTAKLDK